MKTAVFQTTLHKLSVLSAFADLFLYDSVHLSRINFEEKNNAHLRELVLANFFCNLLKMNHSGKFCKKSVDKRKWIIYTINRLVNTNFYFIPSVSLH